MRCLRGSGSKMRLLHLFKYRTKNGRNRQKNPRQKKMNECKSFQGVYSDVFLSGSLFCPVATQFISISFDNKEGTKQ